VDTFSCVSKISDSYHIGCVYSIIVFIYSSASSSPAVVPFSLFFENIQTYLYVETNKFFAPRILNHRIHKKVDLFTFSIFFPPKYPTVLEIDLP